MEKCPISTKREEKVEVFRKVITGREKGTFGEIESHVTRYTLQQRIESAVV
jgi:hypothetical protein